MEKIYEMNTQKIEAEREVLLDELGVREVEKGVRVFLAIGSGAMFGSALSSIFTGAKTYMVFSVAVMFVFVAIFLKKFNKFSEKDLAKEFTLDELKKIDKYKNLETKELERILGIRRLVVRENTIELHKFNIITEINKRDIQEVKLRKDFILIKVDKKSPTKDLIIPTDIFENDEEKNIFLGEVKKFKEVKAGDSKVDLDSIFNIEVEKKREKLFKSFIIIQIIGLINMCIAVILQYGEIDILGGAYIISVIVPTVLFIIGYISMQKEKFMVKVEKDHIKIIGNENVRYIRRFEKEEVQVDKKYFYIDTTIGRMGRELKTFENGRMIKEAVEKFN